MALKLGLVVGEPSGDRLGAGLVRALQAHTRVEPFGVGGELLSQLGLASLVDLEELSMHGFSEPLRRLPFLWSTLKRVEEQMLDERVDAFVGVDFNVFNLLLEARLKRRGVPVVHYVSPSVYAWRRGRTRQVARSCDVLLTLFPFEPPLYEHDPVRAVFVGHPLADDITPVTSLAEARSRRESSRVALGLAATAAPDELVVTLMPGSRASEIRQMLLPFLQAALLVAQQRPGVRFLLPCATDRIEVLVRQRIGEDVFSSLPLTLVCGQARDALCASDAALIKSGTSTLEAMLVGVPMVVAYRLPSASYQIVRRLLRTDFVALPNILAGEALVPELLQNDMQPAALAGALATQLDGDARVNVRARFLGIHQTLRSDASATAAREVLGLATSRGGYVP